MSGNGYGGYRVNRHDEMAAYDAAPPQLRWLIRNAVAPWAMRHMLQEYHRIRRELSQAETLRLIANGMIPQEQAMTIQAYGPTHPEAVRRDH